ncbi:MAG: DUF5591 domain-containing protein [Methanomicrobiaceae archaeon]|nr:DUF5591 domain-containing protein [Methanomicrobiaceae archaeon]
MHNKRNNPQKSKKFVVDRKGERIEIYDPPFYRTEFEDAYRFIIEDYAIKNKEIAIFIPCALRKPYSQSPSHKLFHKIIEEILPKDRYHVLIFGTCGTVPSELELMYPYSNYHYMLGKCQNDREREDFHKIEVYRLKGFLEKTKNTYTKRIAYCIGPFRKALVEACEKTGTDITILPTDPMIEKMYDIDCPFPEGSLSMQEYIDEFKRGILALK